MKVSNEHIELLAKWIKKMMEDNKISKAEIEENYKEKNEERKLWDIYWASMKPIIAKELIMPQFAIYNDTHITTALKHIWKNI